MAFDPNAYPDKPRTSGGRQVIQPGKHRVTVQAVEWDSMKATLEVTFSAGDAAIRGWYPSEGPRAWLLAGLLRAVGWPHTIEPQSSRSTDRALLGQELEIVVTEDEWQGKRRVQVKYTNRLPGTSDRPAPTDAPDDDAQPDDDIPF
jgi:hypothetical protein